MKVLIVHPSIYVYGGAEILITQLANHLSKQGIENALLTSSILPEMRNKLKDTKIILPRKQHKKGFLTILTLIYEAMNLRREIYKRIDEFDVINVHNFPAELSIFLVPKPTIWMCNEPPELYLSSKSKYALISALLRVLNKGFLLFDKLVVSRYIDKVVVSDKFNANRFKKIYGIVPSIIHYGVDYKFFSWGDGEWAKNKFDLHDSFILIQVGMLTPFKNQMRSVKAVKDLKEEIPNIKLLLVGGVGEREYAEKLKKYVRDNGLSPFVIFTGHVPHEQVRNFYHASDAALFPIGAQGGWLSLFEALSANVPVVVSREMTASEIIKKENLGIVTDDFVKAIKDLYKNPEEHQVLAEKGREWVKNNLSWDKYCEQMVELFKKTIKERKNRRRRLL